MISAMCCLTLIQSLSEAAKEKVRELDFACQARCSLANGLSLEKEHYPSHF